MILELCVDTRRNRTCRTKLVNFDATLKQEEPLPLLDGMDGPALNVDGKLIDSEIRFPAAARKRQLSTHGIQEERSRYGPASRPEVSLAAKKGKYLVTCDRSELCNSLTPEWACKLKPAVPEETVASGGSRLVECIQCGKKRGGARPFINVAYCLAKETTWPSHVRDVPRAKRDDDRKLLWEIWETVKQYVCKANLLRSKRRDTSKTWLATSVDAKVEIEDPKTNLKILSWNSGGIKDIQRLLVQTQPHLLLLQEARSINGNHNALSAQCMAVGYSVSPPRADGLVCVWLRGVSVAPLKNPEGEKHMKK